MTLFQFDQMFLIVPKNEAVSITQIWLKLLEFPQMFLNVCKFKWSGCILLKLEWSC